MSYSIDHSIFDSSVDDVNMLSTKRDNKIIQSGRSIIQYEPAIVLDIVLNDSHPMRNSGRSGSRLRSYRNCACEVMLFSR